MSSEIREKTQQQDSAGGPGASGSKTAQHVQRRAARGEPADGSVVRRDDDRGVAIITLSRPDALNALNAAVFDQLEAHLLAVREDDSVVGAVITGSGSRAFAAGADIKELVRIENVAGLVAKSRRGQAVFDLAENLGKPVVAAMNGLAFGGGLELAMSCTARVAAAGQRVFAGQPEPKLGVIPGYGGTQRLPRLVGLVAAWPMLRKGEPISSARAVEVGLVSREVVGDQVVSEATELCRALASGAVAAQPMETGPIPVPEELPEVDLGHLSQKIDEIARRVILAGARVTLAEGLRLEAEAFGECGQTRDFQIGMRNFIENGPKAPARFVHE